MSLCVRDLMTPDPLTLSARQSLYDAWSCMREQGFRHLPVTDDAGEIVGLLTDRDLLSTGIFSGEGELDILDRLRQMRVSAAMVRHVELAEADEPLADVATKMLEGKLGCMPVVEGLQVVGILTEADFVRYVADQAE
ncbi:MAG TPA: CBS domain-containing protein [Deltaproteobacteria bacterium]|nr:CBS domain-containing protein [Deltaproteobacteria bacterium]